MRRLYRKYQRAAELRGLDFKLSLEDFHRITSSECSYCDRPPAQQTRNYTFNGIDRLDGRAGYVLENCTPCCRECNFVKRNDLTPGETRAVAQALKEYRKGVTKNVTPDPITPTARPEERRQRR